MKTVTPQRLNRAYMDLFPGENRDTAECETIMGNWLERYQQDPAKAIATQNWYGKVTQALFKALGLKQPRSKREMLIALGISV